MTNIGILSIFKRKDPRINHDLNDDDRDGSANTRRLKAELRAAQHEHDMALEQLRFEQKRLQLQQSIQELRDDIEDYNSDYDDPVEGGSTEDKLLSTLLTSILAKSQGQASTPAAALEITPTENTPENDPTDQELRDLWKKLPANVQIKAREMIKK